MLPVHVPGSVDMSAYPWVSEQGQGAVERRPYGAVSPALEAKLRGIPLEITDEEIDRLRPGHRGKQLERLEEIISACDNPDFFDDPRWLDLKLRAMDRVAKLLHLYDPDPPKVRQGPGNPADLARQASLALDSIQESLSLTSVPKTS